MATRKTSKVAKAAVRAERRHTRRLKKGTKRVARTVVKIRYVRTRQGRVRFQPVPAQGRRLSPSYASRQGARRAACKAFKGYKVVWTAEAA